MMRTNCCLLALLFFFSFNLSCTGGGYWSSNKPTYYSSRRSYNPTISTSASRSRRSYNPTISTSTSRSRRSHGHTQTTNWNKINGTPTPITYNEELGFSEEFLESVEFEEEAGGFAEVICRGKGTPPLQIRWYGQNDTLLSDTATLTVHLEQPRNLTVTCRVSNINGSVEQDVRVSVTEKEEFPDHGGDSLVATVHCHGDRMTLSLPEKPNYSLFHLLNRSCEFEGDTQDIEAPLEACGTKVYYNETHIIYKNHVTGLSSEEESQNDSPISRDDNLRITFECAYKRTGNTDNVSWEARGQVTVDIRGAGTFTFVLDLYESSDFLTKRNSSQYPVRLSVQDNIYLEVALLSPDDSLSLTVSDIRASDSPSGTGGSFSYSLVENGCIVDSTFQYIESEDAKRRRFTLKAFHFMSSSSVVYLHAFVKICNKLNESCTELCVTDKVQRRSVGSTQEEAFHIFQGPFVTMETGPKMRVVSGGECPRWGLLALFSLLLTLLH